MIKAGVLCELKDDPARLGAVEGAATLFALEPDGQLCEIGRLAHQEDGWRFQARFAVPTRIVIYFPLAPDELGPNRKFHIEMAASVAGEAGSEMPLAIEEFAIALVKRSRLSVRGRTALRGEERRGRDVTARGIVLLKAAYPSAADAGLAVTMLVHDADVRVTCLELVAFRDDFCTASIFHGRTQRVDAPSEAPAVLDALSGDLPLLPDYAALPIEQDARRLLGREGDCIAVFDTWQEAVSGLPEPDVRAEGVVTFTTPELLMDKLRPRRIVGPSRYLVKLEKAVLAPRGLIARPDGAILPDTFRRYPRPHPHKLGMIADGSMRLAPPLGSLGSIEGPAIWLSTEHDGHFGHLILETLSKCWICHDPSLSGMPVVVNGFLDELHIRLLELAGIERERIVFLTAPALVQKLVVPSQLFILDFEANPFVKLCWERVVRNHVSEPSLKSRIYISRRKWTLKRRMLNEFEVEQLMMAHDFDIVYLEELSIDEKVAVLQGADIVCGALGSGLHCTMFGKRGARVIALSPDGLFQNNLTIIGRQMGQPIDFLFGPIAPDEGEKIDSYYTNWTMDLTLLRRFLEKELA